MRRTLAAALLLTLPVFGGGCTALYFYEAARISLTVEARPDSSQPVQGNLGFKQRTAVVAPPKSDGESAGMISSFRFGRSGGFPGTIDIRTALVTGDAVPLAVGERQELAQAISGTYLCERLCECLKTWRKQDKSNIKKLGTWMEGKGLANEPTMFISSDAFSDAQRGQAIKDLKIPCP